MIRTTLGIDGMMCGMCETHVSDAIRRNFDVKRAKSNRRKKTCVVISEDELDSKRVAQVIGETGYELLSCDSEPYVKKGLGALFGR